MRHRILISAVVVLLGSSVVFAFSNQGTQVITRLYLSVAGSYLQDGSEGAELHASITDDASAVAFAIDTDTPLTTEDALLLSIRNNGTQKAYFNDGGRLVHEDAGWDDMAVSLFSFVKAGAPNPPDYEQLTDDGAGSPGVYVYHFDEDSREDVFYSVQAPHSWKPGTDLRFHIHWCPTTTNTGTVRWGIEYVLAAGANGSIGTTTTLYSDDPADGTAYKTQVATFTVISGAGHIESFLTFCRVFRDASHANDTYTDDAALCSADFHIRKEKMGTRNYSPPWGK